MRTSIEFPTQEKQHSSPHHPPVDSHPSAPEAHRCLSATPIQGCGRFRPNGTTPQILRLRLVDVPGWHATIDGKPLQLIRFAGVMLQARIPPGHHTIELQYWPDTFTAGIVVAMVTVVALVLALALGHHRRTRKVSSVQDEDKDEFLPVTTDRPG